MSHSKEHIIRGQEIAAAFIKERLKTRLIIEAGRNPFETAQAIAEIYRQRLNNSKVSADLTDSVVLIESAQLSRAYQKWQNFIRLIPGAGSIEIVYTGSGSFIKSVLPLVLIGRFFGKEVSLFYYPDESIDGSPGWFDCAVLSICNKVHVASRFLQRQLFRQKIKSVLYNPPNRARFFETREIVSVQPIMLVVERNGLSAGLLSVLKAFELVKQKYPRAELIVLTQKEHLIRLQLCEAMRTINGVDFRLLDDFDSLPKSFAEADLFVNCSSSETVSIPMTCAMSVGLPVISFDSSGSRELIDHGRNGILVRHNDIGALAGAVIDLIESPETVAKISNMSNISNDTKKRPKP